jgi:aspartyl-tRNA(Asn)/glutamyl-tRNA(Gln) amidotransferase subunit B
MTDAGDLSATAAKQVLDGVLAGEGAPRAVAEKRDLIQIRDEGALAAAVADVISAHPDEVARIADGDDKLIGFLVGQVMKATGGKADPRRVSELIRESVS